MRPTKGKKVFGIFIFIGVFAAITAIVMLLWNALIPSIIGFTAINYWQSAGLIILSRLLIGGFGKMKHAGHMFGAYHMGRNKHDMMKHFHDDMKGMSHNERRDYIRQRMANFEGFNGFPNCSEKERGCASDENKD